MDLLARSDIVGPDDTSHMSKSTKTLPAAPAPAPSSGSSWVRTLSVIVAFTAVLVFVAMRVTETSSFFGQGGSPGLLGLLRGRSNSDVAQTFENYDQRSERLADGSVHEQVCVTCAF
jgi:hypothetical protein